MEKERLRLSAILQSIQKNGFSELSLKKTVFRFLEIRRGKIIVETLLQAAAAASSQTSGTSDVEKTRLRNTYQHIVKLLANTAGNRDFYDEKMTTVLHWATKYGWMDIVQSLLKEGADVNAKDELHNTPLLLFVTGGQQPLSPINSLTKDEINKMIDLFIESGADYFCCNRAGISLLHVAASNGWIDKVRFLLEKGADPNKANNVGFTPLHLAVSNSHLDVVALLLESGAVTSRITFLRYTPLHMAVEKNNFEIVKYLVEKGADVNDNRFQRGLTPLNVACLKQNVRIIEYLVDAVNKKNGSNETPLKFIMRHHANVALIKKFVSRYGYFTNFVDNHYKALGDPTPDNNIFRNVKACARAVIEKHNHLDLPYFYIMFSPITTLPPIHNLRITSPGVIQDIEQTVKNEIRVNEIFDLKKPKVLVLSMLAVKTLIDYYGHEENVELKRSASAALLADYSIYRKKVQCLD